MWAKEEYEVPESQFNDRIERVRAFAEEHNLGAVAIYSAPRLHQWTQTGHVGYLTNWSNLDRVTDTVAVVPRKGELVLLVPGIPYMLQQIEEVSWIRDVRMVSSPDPRAIAGAYDESVSGKTAEGGPNTFGGEICAILEAASCADQPIAISGLEGMSALIHRDITTALKGRIIDVPDIVADLRAIKSPEEVAIMRQVAHISDRCYETMMDVLDDGILGYELAAEMDRTAKRLGADMVYHTMHSAQGGDLEAGKLSVKSHDLPLRRGDYINLNSYIVHKGYWIQGDRAGTIGDTLESTAGPALRTNLEIQDEILSHIKPGLAIGEMVDLAIRRADEHGYDIQGGRIGHGQGLDYSEKPFLMADSTEPLTPGMVFVLHVVVSPRGSDILLNPIADLCHVTEDGVEVLNKFHRGIFHA